MSKYTTIRVKVEDKKRIEKLAKLLGLSISDTLRYMIDIAEREFDKETSEVDLKILLDALRKARDIGETDASRVDEYLYGGTD